MLNYLGLSSTCSINSRSNKLITAISVSKVNNFRATKIMKCFHNGSHSQYSNGFKDLSSTEESINEILKLVQEKDFSHYGCLVQIATEVMIN